MRLADWTGRPVTGPFPNPTEPGPTGADPSNVDPGDADLGGPDPGGAGPTGPDGWPGLVPVGPGDLDGDGDGMPDTVVATRETGGAWLFTDTDADGFADRMLDLEPPDSGLLAALFRAVTG